MTKQILIAGFGGQGVLFAGKLLAYEGLLDGKEVSWLPSYGPEMRGGTANCSITVSDAPIGSPIVANPDILIAMNKPSLDKYLNETRAGGQIFYDSSLIEGKVEREGVEIYPIPATRLADDEGLKTLANIIMLGNMIAKNDFVTLDGAKKALTKVVSERHKDLLDFNAKALTLGFEYKN
ncbi:MAG: 2-oxoacid:acceptor oxidoreductase family protein [Clostridia bacterium]|jgi:2-oxoglutarate ferredoxin oxidoreductase subunit gamma|nr:2-oxoacid:acceptor oxidoreductase family protein [Clostridia bacterium]